MDLFRLEMWQVQLEMGWSEAQQLLLQLCDPVLCIRKAEYLETSKSNLVSRCSYLYINQRANFQSPNFEFGGSFGISLEGVLVLVWREFVARLRSLLI
jgi:hypothetical protein